MGKESNENLKPLDLIKSTLTMSIDFRPIAVYKGKKWAIMIDGIDKVYFEPEKDGEERIIVLALEAYLKEAYERLAKKVDKIRLAQECYYHIVGQVGALIRSYMPEEKRAMPKWMKKYNKPYHPFFFYTDSTHGGFHIDHPFYSKEDEFISEPYNMSMEDFENLVAFCKEAGLIFHARGESKHFPGHTFRIVIKPRVAEKPKQDEKVS